MQSGDTLRLWDIGGVKARQIGAWSHEVDGKRESIVDGHDTQWQSDGCSSPSAKHGLPYGTLKPAT